MAQYLLDDEEEVPTDAEDTEETEEDSDDADETAEEEASE